MKFSQCQKLTRIKPTSAFLTSPARTSMQKSGSRLSFTSVFLGGFPPETIRQKPEILVEQTLYIILLAKIDTAACGDAGVVRSVLLRILPRMFFPFCLPPTFSSNELSSCSVHPDRLAGDDHNQPASHPDRLVDDDHNHPATQTAWLMMITTSQPPRPPG